MARSSRTWGDLSPEGRQRALIVLGVVGLVIVAIIAFVVIGGSDGDKANATVGASTPTVSGSVTTWYEGTVELRGEMINASTAVRAYVEAEDGVLLQPACVSLGEQAAKAVAYEPAPDDAIQRLWSDGATGYADAAATCGTLWALPVDPVPVILAKVTSELDDADQAWADLAERVGQPLPDVPTGTMAPVRTATRAPSATPSVPVAPTAGAPASSSPATPPPISIGPIFETPSESASPTQTQQTP